MSAVTRTGQAAVLIITALLHASVAEGDGGSHESAGHHGVQGQANSGTLHEPTKLQEFKKMYVTYK